MPFYASDEEIAAIQAKLDGAREDIDGEYAARVAAWIRHEYGSAAIDVVMLVLSAASLVDAGQDA
jgi:hypothetical protein